MVQQVDFPILEGVGNEAPEAGLSVRRMTSERPGWEQVRKDLTDAFLRFAQRKRFRDFNKCLKNWVTERRKAGFQVDYIDPEATKPSDAFYSHLKEKFSRR